MEVFSKNLRRRVEELGLSLAEVGRRAGLSERRFTNYASGSREPDLATLLAIAAILDTSPNELLGVKPSRDGVEDESAELRRQLAADARVLDVRSLRLAIGLVRTVIEHQHIRRGKRT